MRPPSRGLKGGFPLCHGCFRRVQPDIRDLPGLAPRLWSWKPRPVVALSGRHAAAVGRERELSFRGYWYVLCDDCRVAGGRYGYRLGTNLRFTPHKRHPRRERRHPPLGRRR